jgi:excisionase family DNA binding protein
VNIKTDARKTKNIDLDRLLTVEELAAKLSISVRTVRDWRYKRRLPFTRIGNRLYVPVGAVEELLGRNMLNPLQRQQGSKSQGTEEVQKGDSTQ